MNLRARRRFAGAVASALHSIDGVMRNAHRSPLPAVDACRSLSKASCWLAEATRALRSDALPEAACALSEAASALLAASCRLSRTDPALSGAASGLSLSAATLAQAARVLAMPSAAYRQRAVRSLHAR
jgi:hypothetical protein